MPYYRSEKIIVTRYYRQPQNRFRFRKMICGNESEIALQSHYLYTKTAFYPDVLSLSAIKKEKFSEFING
ncbi:hypothetical protein AL515_23490 [Citrobacter sp. FDAARGOS_156]|nr:hypothetical protein AL515_23490 [Citrobacter sp. FDAARGOS_156]